MAGHRRCRLHRAGARLPDPPTVRAGRRSRHQGEACLGRAREILRRGGDVARVLLTVAANRRCGWGSPTLPEARRIHCSAVNAGSFPGVVAGWERCEAAGGSPGHAGASHGSRAPIPATGVSNPHQPPKLREVDRRCAASGCRGLTGRLHCLVGPASPVARPGLYNASGWADSRCFPNPAVAI
ncbi:hypothetical protein BSG18_26310 [Pseudomonas ogarae]|nr:hypothetical protein BSG18_26310 [Pseudomonas ogarae]